MQNRPSGIWPGVHGHGFVLLNHMLLYPPFCGIHKIYIIPYIQLKMWNLWYNICVALSEYNTIPIQHTRLKSLMMTDITKRYQLGNQIQSLIGEKISNVNHIVRHQIPIYIFHLIWINSQTITYNIQTLKSWDQYEMEIHEQYTIMHRCYITFLYSQACYIQHGTKYR